MKLKCLFLTYNSLLFIDEIFALRRPAVHRTTASINNVSISESREEEMNHSLHHCQRTAGLLEAHQSCHRSSSRASLKFHEKNEQVQRAQSTITTTRRFITNEHSGIHICHFKVADKVQHVHSRLIKLYLFFDIITKQDISVTYFQQNLVWFGMYFAKKAVLVSEGFSKNCTKTSQ